MEEYKQNQEDEGIVSDSYTEKMESEDLCEQVEAVSDLGVDNISEEINLVIDNYKPVDEIIKKDNEKKSVNKKIIGIVIATIIAIVVAVLTIVYFTVIQPNSIYDDAVAALDSSDFQECERLLEKIPNHESTPYLRKQLTYKKAESYIAVGELDLAESLLALMIGDSKAEELKNEIQYLKAEELVSQKKYEEAQSFLDKIPDYEDSLQLRKIISYQKALSVLETGDYKTAYEIFSQLGDYSDSSKQKEIVYYEALAFKSLFNVQASLKNPASLRVQKVTFYKDSSVSGELDAIYEINATNSFGGSIGGYAYDLKLYDEEDDSGMISFSAYVDPDDYYDLLSSLLVDAIQKQDVFKTSVDVARMNRLIVANASFNIDLPFKSSVEVES